MSTSDVMFQAFKEHAQYNNRIGEWYQHLETKVDDLADAGIKAVWLPPATKNLKQDWLGYQPMDYYDLGEYRQWYQEDNRSWVQHTSENTYYGTKDQLISLINNLKNKNIKCIADIVINHRIGQQFNTQDERISWGGPEHTIESGKMAWGKNDPNPQEISDRNGGSSADLGGRKFNTNIAHTNHSARNDIKKWLKWLIDDIGFDGFRYDYVKGFQAKWIADYNYSCGNPFSVGECWDSTQVIYDWIDETDGYHVSKKSKAFDFPLQVHLKEIFWGAKPFSELGLWKYSNISIAGGWSDKAVTFLCSHDMEGKPYKDFPTEKKKLIQGYVFLLTHNGIPTIYWSDFYERSNDIHDTIKMLCNFRKNEKITNNSDIVVLCSSDSCYAAKIDNHVIVKIGDDFWSPYGNQGYWDLRHYGEGWAIWVNSHN